MKQTETRRKKDAQANKPGDTGASKRKHTKQALHCGNRYKASVGLEEHHVTRFKTKQTKWCATGFYGKACSDKVCTAVLRPPELDSQTTKKKKMPCIREKKMPCIRNASTLKKRSVARQRGRVFLYHHQHHLGALLLCCCATAVKNKVEEKKTNPKAP